MWKLSSLRSFKKRSPKPTSSTDRKKEDTQHLRSVNYSFSFSPRDGITGKIWLFTGASVNQFSSVTLQNCLPFSWFFFFAKLASWIDSLSQISTRANRREVEGACSPARGQGGMEELAVRHSDMQLPCSTLDYSFIVEAITFFWRGVCVCNSRTASPTRFLNVTFKNKTGRWCVHVCKTSGM